MNKILKFILDLIFPIYCVNCKKEGEWVCEECKKLLIIDIKQKKNLDNLTYVGDIFYFYDFDNKIISDLIHILKYKYAYDVSRFISSLIYNDFMIFYASLKEKYGEFIFIPIPLNKKRFNERGFNQSEIMLKKLKKEKNYKTKTENFDTVDLLRRIRNTEHQASLSGGDRDNNLKNAFVLNNGINIEDYKNFNIILFDDVVTTGNTIDECAKVLRSNGFKNKIIGLAVAG